MYGCLDDIIEKHSSKVPFRIKIEELPGEFISGVNLLSIDARQNHDCYSFDGNEIVIESQVNATTMIDVYRPWRILTGVGTKIEEQIPSIISYRNGIIHCKQSFCIKKNYSYYKETPCVAQFVCNVNSLKYNDKIFEKNDIVSFAGKTSCPPLITLPFKDKFTIIPIDKDQMVQFVSMNDNEIKYSTNFRFLSCEAVENRIRIYYFRYLGLKNKISRITSLDKESILSEAIFPIKKDKTIHLSSEELVEKTYMIKVENIDFLSFQDYNKESVLVKDLICKHISYHNSFTESKITLPCNCWVLLERKPDNRWTAHKLKNFNE
jgi:hypothetical protein